MDGTPRDYILDEIRSIEGSIKDVSEKVNALDKTVAEYKVSFDHHIQADEDMYTELKRMNDILASNTESLKAHMRRTELNEQRLELFESALLKLGTRLSDLEIKQIEEKAVQKWISSRASIVGKIAAALAALAGLAAMLPDLIKWLIK